MFRLALCLALLGCGLKAPPQARDQASSSPADATPPADQADIAHPDAVEGVSDVRLRGLLDRHWRHTLDRRPEWATAQGYPGYADRLFDPSPQARTRDHQERAALIAAAEAIPVDALGPADRVTHRLFLEQLVYERDEEVCRTAEWSLSARFNAYTYAGGLHHGLPITSEERSLATLARLGALPLNVRRQGENLRIGLADGLVANARSVELVIQQIEADLERPVEEWPLWTPIAQARGLTDDEREALEASARKSLIGPIRAAFREYLAILRDEILPVARPDDRAGIAHLPLGPACYAAVVRTYTTLPEATPAERHEVGLAELRGIHAEFRELGQKVFGTSDLAAIFERLRTDPALYFGTEDEVEQAARDALDKARQAMPRYFGRLPQRECIVERMPAHEAPYSTIAYYRQPTVDQPGRYTINTYAPTTRPRYEAEVLAYHESIPGHHLQIAIAQELDAMPAFRRHQGMTVFVEGWALYTERLSDEMGLYESDLSRLGVLSFDAWRASRLVVDTGLHDKGWSRAQAERFMAENSPLALNNIANEVDRYITWPGQALAYKTGQIVIRELRAQAEQELGDAFDLPGFHDAVLGGGAVSVPVLRAQVAAWVASRRPAE